MSVYRDEEDMIAGQAAKKALSSAIGASDAVVLLFGHGCDHGLLLIGQQRVSNHPHRSKGCHPLSRQGIAARTPADMPMKAEPTGGTHQTGEISPRFHRSNAIGVIRPCTTRRGNLALVMCDGGR